MVQTPLNLPVCFFCNRLLLNGLNPNLGSIAYFGKFSKLSEKKMPNQAKKKTFSKIAAPCPTSSVSFEAVLSNKDESCIGQLFMRSPNYAI